MTSKIPSFECLKRYCITEFLLVALYDVSVESCFWAAAPKGTEGDACLVQQWKFVRLSMFPHICLPQVPQTRHQGSQVRPQAPQAWSQEPQARSQKPLARPQELPVRRQEPQAWSQEPQARS